MDPSKLFQATKKKLDQKMKRTRYFDSSDMSEEKSDREVESFPEKTSSKSKSPERRRQKKGERSVTSLTSTSSDRDTTVIEVEPTADNRYFNNSSSEVSEQARTSRRRFTLQKTKNVRSIDVEAAESDNDNFGRKSVDIVVDVHCENDALKSISQTETSNKSKTNSNNMLKIQEKGTKLMEERTKKVNRVKAVSQESLDLIEELKDSGNAQNEDSGDEKIDIDVLDEENKYFERHGKSNEGWFQETELQQISSETSGRRKRWKKFEPATLVDDLKKIRRKQWTKDSNSVQIAGNKIENAQKKVDDFSSKSSSNDQLSTAGPVPAPRQVTTTVRNTFEYDNATFSPDQEEEEVLRIETNYYENNTKIEMSMRAVNESDDENSLVSIEDYRPTNEVQQKSYGNKFYESEENVTSDDSRNSDARERSQFQRTHRPKSSTGLRQNEKSKALWRTGNSWHEDAETNHLRRITSKKSRSLSNIRLQKEGSGDSKKCSSQDTTISTSGAYSDTEDQVSVEKRRKKRQEPEKIKKGTRKKSIDRLREKESSRRSRACSSTRGEDVVYKKYGRTKETKGTKKKKEKKKKEDDLVKFISIIIHNADTLEVDYITRHPMVKVHIVEAATGNYFESDENAPSDSLYLQPIITGKFDFKEHKSMTPTWEEELIFECNFDDLIRIEESKQAIIFFEVVDLLTFSEASSSYDDYGSESCWYKIAWAFLRPVGVNGTLHVDKKVRLQLYKPRKSWKKFESNVCEAYEWWKSNSREKYPSSLYVTVSAVEQPKLEPVFYDQLTLYELSDFRSDSQQQLNKTSESESVSNWLRLATQSCKIPNDLFFETDVGENGCFYVSFSHNGKYLACVMTEDNDYPILVYKIHEKKVHVRFIGHKSFVYTLAWSHDDRFLLSVSSDQTARIWDIREKIMQYVQLLPHPSYIYCGKFDLETSSIIATGCYDNVVRVWSKSKRSKRYELVQELDQHTGFVNALCFLQNGSLITADSVGIIIVWTVKKSHRTHIKKEWQISKKIKIKGMKDVIINSIVLHLQQKKLLVHARNNSLVMLSLETGEILQRYQNLRNDRIQTTACISPCGSLVLCGGEDSTLNIWDSENGRHLVKYMMNVNGSAVTCVDYHPFEHILAFSTFGCPSPVKLLKFDKNASGYNVGLMVLIDQDDASRVSTNFTENSSRTAKEERWSSDSRTRHFKELSEINDEADLRHASEYSEAYNFPGSTKRLLDNVDSRRSVIMKLQKFIETIPAGTSTRMNSIIEKIDRILSNASSARSANDIESARIPNSLLNIDIKSSSDIKTDFSGETVRMKDFDHKRKKKNRKHVSKSARDDNCRLTKIDKVKKALSDEAVHRARSTEILIDDEEYNLESNTLDNVDSMPTTSFFVESGFSSFSHEKAKEIEFKSAEPTKQEGLQVVENSLDSDGTYVVEKGEVEKNEDNGSVGNSGSGSSAKSNATFVIENEIPVPKPRRKL